MRTSILVIEDSLDYQLMLKACLTEFYSIELVVTGNEAIKLLNSQPFDLVLVDIVLPDMNGLQICNFIKSQKNLNNTPVILLTSKDSIEDKLKGFDFGADDYITKPFDHRELLARIKSKIKADKLSNNLIKISDLEIDNSKQYVFSKAKNERIDLTTIEYKLLLYFSQRIDHVLSREQILNYVWPDNLNVSERTVDSHVSNLRKKLSGTNTTIDAVRGSGYRFLITKAKAA
ncbi:MAG: response regulator transcription factor [Bdellovibrionales bacterium]|nr:response regulator transcription factor [Bdellovibrionales bacterium]